MNIDNCIKPLSDIELRMIDCVSRMDISEQHKIEYIKILEFAEDDAHARMILHEITLLRNADLLYNKRLQGKLANNTGNDMELIAKRMMEKEFPHYDWHIDGRSVVKGDQLDLVGIKKTAFQDNQEAKHIVAEVKSGKRTHKEAFSQLQDTVSKIRKGLDEYVIDGKVVQFNEQDVKILTIGNQPNFDIEAPTVQEYLNEELKDEDPEYVLDTEPYNIEGKSYSLQGGYIMPKVIVDPEELARFAQNLKQYNEQLKQSTVRVNAQFKQLGSTWQDQEHQKFAQQFQQTMKVISQFLQISEQQVPFLLKKAQRARDYLNQ